MVSDIDLSSPFLVKITPKASRNEVKGWETGADGRTFLKVSVTAVPEKGKANKALITLLSKMYNVPRSQIEILRGETDKYKLIQMVK
jgi:uncharacterized protein (TIGR00251 family)